MDEGKRDVTRSSRGRWKKTRRPKQPKYSSPVLMPASTLRSLQNLCSDREQKERESLQKKKKKKTKQNKNKTKKKKKKKQKPGLFQDQPKTNRSFSGPPNSSRRKGLEKLKRIELRVENHSNLSLPTKEKGTRCTTTASSKVARKPAGYFGEN